MDDFGRDLAGLLINTAHRLGLNGPRKTRFNTGNTATGSCFIPDEDKNAGPCPCAQSEVHEGHILPRLKRRNPIDPDLNPTDRLWTYEHLCMRHKGAFPRIFPSSRKRMKIFPQDTQTYRGGSESLI
ncbi:uncharacterized protein Hap1MRO34_013423 isoform 3-T3 [Clarias gariepinus]